MIKRILLLIFLTSIFACQSKKEIIYFQGIENLKANDAAQSFEPKLKPDDLLLIIVSAQDPEAAAPFNLSAYSDSGASSDKPNGSLTYQTYLVDTSGFIEFPVLGRLKVGGLTKSEAVEMIKTELRKYIISPIVNLRITNYKVSVMGEVTKPGSYDINTERVTLIEALSKAGDLTIYGNRKNILIIRNVNGEQTNNFIDLTSPDFINSPFYYLTQNDVVYVQPNKTKVNSSVIGPNVTATLTALSLLITVIALLIK